MIKHTMLVSFTDPIPDVDLNQYLIDIEEAMAETGAVSSFSSQRHIAVPGEEEIPALIATAILEFTVADEAALGTLFAAPRAGDVIHAWQARYPYKVAWANHHPLA